jgi:hypothetical protein
MAVRDGTQYRHLILEKNKMYVIKNKFIFGIHHMSKFYNIFRENWAVGLNAEKGKRKRGTVTCLLHGSYCNDNGPWCRGAVK